MKKLHLILITSLAVTAGPVFGNHSIMDHLREPAVRNTIQAILLTTCGVSCVKLLNMSNSLGLARALRTLEDDEVQEALGTTAYAAKLVALACGSCWLYCYA